MEVLQVTSEVSLSVEEIVSWVIKIVATLATVIVVLGGVVAYLFKTLIAEQKKWSETQMEMQKETNQIINDNTTALNGLSEGLKSIPDQIETVLKLHLTNK